MGATHRGEESMFLIWEPITGTETLEHHWSDVTGDHSPNPVPPLCTVTVLLLLLYCTVPIG
eukprot:4720990-Pyramimonas_sp.AAC.1